MAVEVRTLPVQLAAVVAADLDTSQPMAVDSAWVREYVAPSYYFDCYYSIHYYYYFVDLVLMS